MKSTALTPVSVAAVHAQLGHPVPALLTVAPDLIDTAMAIATAAFYPVAGNVWQAKYTVKIDSELPAGHWHLSK